MGKKNRRRTSGSANSCSRATLATVSSSNSTINTTTTTTNKNNSINDNNIPAPKFEDFDFRFPKETLTANNGIKQQNVISLMRHCQAIRCNLSEPEFDEHIMMHQGVDWYPLVPPRSNATQLACLGVPPTLEYIPGFKNLIDVKNSQYAALPRPSRAPGKCTIILPNQEAQQVVDKFWNGDFVVTLYNPNERNAIPTTLEMDTDADCFCLQAAATYTRADGQKDICLFRVKSLAGLHGQKGMSFQSSTTVPLFALLYQETDQYKLLECRILHQFLRQYAWMLPKTCLQAWVQRAIIPFQGRKKYASTFLDIAMILADVNTNRPYKYKNESVTTEDVGVYLTKAAEALETMSKKGSNMEPQHYFLEAGKLYLESVQRYLGSDSEVYTRVAGNARRVNDYGLAIHYCAICLQSWGSHPVGSNWNFDEKQTNKFICNLYVVFQEVDLILGQNRVGKGKYIETSDEKLFRGFASLLACSLFCPGREDLVPLPKVFQAKEFLKPQYGSPIQAKQTLVKIFETSGTGQALKDNIVETMIVAPIPTEPPEKQDPESLVRDHRVSLKAARDFAKFMRLKSVQVCNFCRKREEIIDGQHQQKHLACGRCCVVYYCSKTCQIADWKDHKDTCKFTFAMQNS